MLKEVVKKEDLNESLWHSVRQETIKVVLTKRVKSVFEDEVDGSGDEVVLLKEYKSNRDLMADFRKGNDLRQRSRVFLYDIDENK